MHNVSGIFLIISIIFILCGLGTEKVKAGIISFIIGLSLLYISMAMYTYENHIIEDAKMYEEDKIVVVHDAKMSFDEENKKAYVYYEDSDGYIYKVYFEN